MPLRKPLILICTVGISLPNNLARLDPLQHAGIRRALADRDAGRLAAELSSMPCHDRTCGAEINSIASLLSRKWVQDPPAALHLCVSDTDDGRFTGEVLRLYYQRQAIEVKAHVIPDLQHADPERFRTHGLRNLVRAIGEVVRATGDPSRCAINATGGYKAQMAVAVLIGQALGVGVFYKHELFDQVAAIPPMPVSFDWDLLGRHADLLDQIEAEDTIEAPEADIPEALRPLLEEAPAGADGRALWALAPIGQIYIEGFRTRFPVVPTLPKPWPTAERSEPTFRDDHYPDGFKAFVTKVWRDSPYVKTCYSVPYDRQAAIRDRRFYLRPGDREVVGEFRDRAGFGARFVLLTGAAAQPQRVAVVQDLNQRFGR